MLKESGIRNQQFRAMVSAIKNVLTAAQVAILTVTENY